ncbi:MAG: ABC transporter ATP-binding protein [Halobacteriales archaeon]
MSLIDIENVSFTYRTQPDEAALSNVTVSVERGEFIGVTGPSDAGKTTLCRLFPGYIPHFFDGELTGEITVDGTDIRETSIGDMSSEVGLVFENPFDQLTGSSMTVLEEVAFGLENMGLPREEIIDRVHESLETVGIEDLIGRNPQELSGGQSQRLAIASILAMRPEILILDEPTSQLDPKGTEEVFEVVAQMDQEGYTVILVSQDLERLAPHLDRLWVFEDGSLRLNGPPQDVLTSDDPTLDSVPIPEVVQIGSRLRSEGFIDADTPVPLSLPDTVEELRPHVASKQRANGGTETETAAPTPTGTNDAGIEIEDVHFYYNDEIHALRGISLTLQSGCVCMIGQNGAGKTTFAKHLNGLLEPDEGRVLVNGMDTQDHTVAELAHEVGFSFQNPDDQLFHSNVREEVQYGPRNLGYDEETIDRLTDEAMEELDLTAVADKNPYDLGLPRRKRVAVASVLAMDTPIVVLDEPTGGQDGPGNQLLGAVVEDLVAAGKLVIVITHDVSFARDHADRVIALGQGEVLLDGNPRTVFSEEATLAETMVEPPKVTRIGNRLDLPETVLTIDELFAHIG